MVTNPGELHQMRAAVSAWYTETARQRAQPGIRWLHAVELKAPYGLDERVFGPPGAMMLQHAAYTTLPGGQDTTP